MDFSTLLKAKFPEGKGNLQCVKGLHQIFDFPYMGVDPNGNDVNLKFSLIKKDGNCYPVGNIAEIAKGYRIGDCVFTTEGAVKHWYGWTGAGHMACIIGFDRGDLILFEWNYNLDGKATYGRRLSMASPKIIGIGRFPFLNLKIKPIINLNVFFNKMVWKTSIFKEISDTISKMTEGNLEVNFIPIMNTRFKDWDYEGFPFNGLVYQVIKKSYLHDYVLPLTYPGVNGYILVVNKAEWGGTVIGNVNGEEIAWTSFEHPTSIQMCCEENDVSPYYQNMPRFTHAVIHELGHYLNYVGGSKSDLVDSLDSKRQFNLILSNLDWTRISLNL